MIKTRIPEIDALRGIACLMVVFNHFRFHPQLNHFGFNIGCVGVDLFFIISGFVISLTIRNNKSSKDFLINRFSRLFPTYWVCVTLSVIAIVLSHKYIGEPPLDLSFLKRYLINLSMLQFYLNATNIDGSYWTLIIELLFYVFIFCFLLIKQTKLIELIGGICLILPISLFVFYNNIIANETLHQLVDAIPLLAYIPLFYSGILCYNLFFNGTKFYRWALLAVSFCIQLTLFDKYYSNGSELTFIQYLITLSLIYLSFILLIYQKMKFLVNPYTIWLGNISFCLYLIHQSIGVFIVTPILHDYFHLNFWIAFILTFALLLFLANLIYTYVEKPSILYIRKHFITT